MPSLTHDEAIERARALTVHSYAVELDLTTGADTFRSVVTIRFCCAQDGASTFAELDGALVSARLNGRELTTGLSDNRLELADLAADNELVVVAEPRYSRTGEGLHRFTDPADDATYVYAMSFLANAQRIFCCFDQPDLKAPLTLSVTAPETWTVLGNERGVMVRPGRWKFVATRPLATYMMTLCAGPYHSVRREHDGIRIGWHCRASLADHLDADADELFDVSAGCLDAYHELFGVRYPFGDSYDQVFVPEFPAGAMENPGCVTFRDELLFRSAVTDAERENRAEIIAHEMAHMWFGDLVTMRWWDDLWLNESFATYLANRVLSAATRFPNSWATFAGTEKMRGYAADQSSWTHPVAPDAVADSADALLNFDAISYPKGASVLRQLAAWLGDDAFVAGLRVHFARHAYGNATLADLVGALAETSGADVDDWARLWLRTSGVNRLTPVVRVDAAGRYAAVSVEQSGVSGAPLRPHRLDVGLYRRAGDTLERYRLVPLTVRDAVTAVPDLVGVPAADLLLLNDNDLTFGTVRFVEGASDRLRELLPAVRDPLTRSLLWSTAWDATRAGDLPARSFVELVAAAVGGEPQVALVASMLRNAREYGVHRYLPDGERAAALALLAGCCRAILADAEPGGGRQLAAFRELVRASTDVGALARLRSAPGLVTDDASAPPSPPGQGSGSQDSAEGDLPVGLDLDTDLRWLVLRRLVVLGGAGEAEIAAEAARDATSSGELHAIRCRAARPDPAGKADAWRAMMTDRSLSNRQVEAFARGFWQPEQGGLTASYIPRFFAEIVDATAGRGEEMAHLLAVIAYPRWTVEQSTVDATDALLARLGVAPGVKRALTASADEVRVALRARGVS